VISAGIGMTSGLIDAGNLTDCLVGIHEGRAGTDILDKFDTVRRDIYHKIIDPLSTSALQRQWTANPKKLVEDDPFIQKISEAFGHENLAMKLQLV
jgi:2-polyprenyl-6-methoxyphenol hydroxylase-like FAD-dependent oxidoreductase